MIIGGDGNDMLDGQSGTDILQAGEGADVLTSITGSALLDGGGGNDSFIGGSGNELIIGGAGNDALTTGIGADIIAINSGDGQDIVTASSGEDNALSLGGGIRYADLSFTRSGEDLVLNTGGTDKVTFEDWYSTSGNQSVVTMQVIAEAMAEFDAGSIDPLLNKKIQTFNFAAIVGAYDAAGQVDNWALSNALLDAHLAASDTEALGGDIAYCYGLSGSLAGIGVGAVQEVLNGAQFGTDAQTLRPLEELQQGQTRLS